MPPFLRRVAAALFGACVAPVATAATYTVTTSADSGAGSLRAAIEAANAASDPDTIAFAIPGSGVHEIAVSSSLPGIRYPVVVDGYTQPGSSVSTAAIGSNAQIRIALVGTGSASVRSLVLLANATGSAIRGLAINRFGGYQLSAIADGCEITGNFIGTDAGGTVGYPSSPGTRLGISVSGNGCRIGGATRASRNVIAGNSHVGIYVGGSDVEVQGNLIGTDRTGVVALGNTCGISIGVTGPGAPVTRNALIGGHNAGVLTPRNVISGNTRCGIEVVSGEGHVIEGNLIGLAALPLAAIPNLGPGIDVRAGRLIRIGAAYAGEVSNGISGNLGPGVRITGSTNPPDDVGVFGNAIFANEGLQIDLGAEGVNPNDPLDADEGPNDLQNFPELTGVRLEGATTRVLGRIDSEADSNYFIDFYAVARCDPSGHGGSSQYLGDVSIGTGASGSALFQAEFIDAPTTGYAVATATRTLGGPTSEFSRCIAIGDLLFADGFEPAK